MDSGKGSRKSMFVRHGWQRGDGVTSGVGFRSDGESGGHQRTGEGNGHGNGYSGRWSPVGARGFFYFMHMDAFAIAGMVVLSADQSGDRFPRLRWGGTLAEDGSMDGMPMPSRSNLVVECVRVLRLRLRSGEWSGYLPGERRLAELLQVGRDTIRIAIQQLEREGLISAAEAGSRRRVLDVEAEERPAKVQSLRIGLLAHRPLEQLPQPTLLEVDQIRRALSAKGGSLEVFAPGWYEHKHPVKRLEAFMAEEPCSAWILLRSTEAMQRWFMQSGLPCLIRGYPHPGIDLPHLDVDWEATARHAAGRLWRLGHQRVGIFIPAEALRGVAAAVKGTLELGEPGFQPLAISENGTTEGIARALARALNLKNPPTALIATRPRQAATALTWLASQGIRVPTDISLISLAREPFLEHLIPETSGYRVDPDTVAKQVLRRISALIAGNAHPGGNSWLTPEVVKGASVAMRGG